MSIIFTDGFDTYTAPILKWDVVGSGGGQLPYILPTAGRNGGGCVVLSGVASPSYLKKTFPNAATMFFGMAIYIPSVSSSTGLAIFADGSTTQIDLNINSSGHFYFTRNGTNLGTQSVNALPFNSWHYIEVLVTIDPTVGVCTLNVDGVNWLNLTGQNTRATSNSFVGSLSVGTFYNQPNSNFLIDDCYIANVTGSFNNAFLGDVRIQGLLPTGNGATLNYTMNASAWAANAVMGVGQTVLDSNGNLQRVIASTGDGKTGGSAPTWSLTLGTTTTDNHVTWSNLGAEAQYLLVNQNPPEGAGTRMQNQGYLLGQMVWDTNRNLQLCTVPGTTANSVNPTWNLTVGGTTTDGGVTWLNLGPGEDTYLSDANIGDISRFTFPAITAPSIKAAVVNLRVRKDDVSTRSVRAAVKSGATLGDNGSDLVLSSTYQSLSGVVEADPATGVAWTQSGFNAAEFGIKTTA